uniref:FAD-binding oxidoreductase n=1 Tax=Polynucleobacter sp. TaxID=2029855 RepID=UPI00404715EE
MQLPTLGGSNLVNQSRFLEECREIIGGGYVYTSTIDKNPYLTDWNKRFSGEAIAVLKPKDVGEVSALVSLCRLYKIAIVPQGGNTGLCGGATPSNQHLSVVICTTRLNKIIEVNIENSTITLEAGVILNHAQEAAKRAGRLFPLSLTSEGSCTIGGNLATNAGGVQVLHYGSMRDLALGLEVVTPTGEIFNGLRGLRKDNTGYSLKDIYIGSEGTLGIITAATLKIFPLPRSKATALVALANAESSIKLLQLTEGLCNAHLTAFELISTRALQLIEGQEKNLGDLTSVKSDWSVLLELSSMEGEENSSAELESLLEKALDENFIIDAVISKSLKQSIEIWNLRESIPERQLTLGTIIKHDISLPISEIVEFIRSTEIKLQKFWPNLQTIIFGHVGDGNLHYNIAPSLPEYSKELEERRHEINLLVHDEVYKYSGSFSAEHGIGQLKRDELVQRKSVIEMQLMRGLKQAFDPEGIMNPGKIL